MSRSSSETQSLRRSAQPTRPCAEAHARPHAQRSSVSYALSPPRSHGTAPRPTDPLRRVPSLNLRRPRSGSSRRSHAQRSAALSAPRDAAPRTRRHHSRTAFGSVAWPRSPRLRKPRRHRQQSARSRHTPRLSRASAGDGHEPASTHAAAVTPCGMREASAVRVARSGHHIWCRCASCRHVRRSMPCMYATIARAQYLCASPRRVRSFLLNLASPVSASFRPVAAVTASPPT